MAKKAKKRDKLAPTKSDKLMEAINEEFGAGTLVKANDSFWVRPPPRISTGSLGLDVVMGGGVPRGRILHLYGQFSSCKTSILYSTIAELQRTKPNARCAIVVIEEFDVDWAVAHGVDPDRLDLAYPESANQGVDVAEQLVRTDEYDIVGYDSIAAGSALALLERSATQVDVIGVAARLNNQFMARIQSALNAKPKAKPNDTAVILINQMRVAFEGPVQRPVAVERPTGGNALKYAAAIGLKLVYRKSEDEYVKDDNLLSRMGAGTTKDGQILRRRRILYITEKNKTFRPYLSGNLWFNLMEHDGEHLGIDRAEETMRLGALCGAIETAGAWATLPDGNRIQGSEGVRLYLRDNPDVLEQVREESLSRFLGMEPVTPKTEISPALGEVEAEAEAVVEEMDEALVSDMSPEVVQGLLQLGLDKGLVSRRGPAWLVWEKTGQKFRKGEFAALAADCGWLDELQTETKEAGVVAGYSKGGKKAGSGTKRKKPTKRGGSRKKGGRKKSSGKR